MYTIAVVFTCLPKKREAFVERVTNDGILDAIRHEDGCTQYEYYFSQSNPNQFLLLETWETKQHQQVHLEQPHMKQLQAFKKDYIINTCLKEYTIL